ncbi:MAG: FISUMP domain-containing protein, partial [Bacteroidales bacterium]|nr:FISUMP domain-containing protein [Bacteroidales bacterium]
MKTRKSIFGLLMITAVLFTANPFNNIALAKEKVCLNDTVLVYADDYRGEIRWQRSFNGSDWSYYNDNEGDTVVLIVSEPFFMRLEVLEGKCVSLYTDALSIEINAPPVLEIDLRDSACINERDFILTGGIPEGGSYFGTGVINGRFDPGSAGIGIHEIGYYYSDPETTCSDTIFGEIEVFPMTSDADAGEDIELIASDSVQLQAAVPDYGTGYWTIVSGEGGVFTDSSDPNSWFRKDTSNLNYVLRWSVEGPCGTSSDEISLNFMELSINPCPGAPVVIDQDGNIYKTIQIGDQCWMAENLRTGTYVASTVKSSIHSNLKDNGIIEKYCFENDTANCTLYGGLYDWHEAMGYSEDEGVQGVCP